MHSPCSLVDFKLIQKNVLEKVFSWILGKSRRHEMISTQTAAALYTHQMPDSTHLLNSIPNLINPLDHPEPDNMNL